MVSFLLCSQDAIMKKKNIPSKLVVEWLQSMAHACCLAAAVFSLDTKFAKGRAGETRAALNG